MHTILQVAAKQRLVWISAVLVALFLSVYGRAPLLPVVAGCLLAVGVSVLRAWPGRPRRGEQ